MYYSPKSIDKLDYMYKFCSYFIFILLLGCNQNSTDKTIDESLPNIHTKTNIGYESMSEAFNNLPNDVRMKSYWLWLNGQVTKESITRELEGMKAKGYGGAVICDALAGGANTKEVPHGADFASPEWMELLAHTVKEADRLGLVLSLNAQSGWNMGGPTVTPAEAMKKLVYTEQKFKGPKTINTKLAFPDTLLYYKDIAVQAFKTPEPDASPAILEWGLKSFNQSIGTQGIYPLEKYTDMRTDTTKDHPILKKEIIDITAHFKNGKLNWDIPEGDWTIVRYGMTCTGKHPRRPSENADGLCLDHLSKKALDSYYEQVILPLIQTAQKAGNSLKYLHTDSWEMGVVNWTQNFREEFKKRRGYDPLVYLPVMSDNIVGNREESNRFLFDLRRTVGDLIAENHYEHFAELCHKNGLLMHPESGGPHAAPIDGLYTMSFNDELMGEYWARANTHRVSEAERLTVKQSASVAHTNGKRFVTAEGPTSVGPQWERSPKDVKGVIDRVFCAGVNKIIWHTFSASPERFGKPGNEYFAGTHLNLNATWWNQADAFIKYLNRSSYLLSIGLFNADVLYYYGSNVPNFVFMKNEFKELEFGYDWDKCSKDALVNRVSFDGEKLILPDGMTYRILVLPHHDFIDLEVLKKVEKMVSQGLTVVAPKPSKATGLTNYPESDEEVRKVADKMWGKINGTTITKNKYGKGQVIWGENINDVLRDLAILPDFEFNSTDKSTELDFIHRRTAAQDIYFVVNRHARKGIDDFVYRYLTELPDRFEQVECKFLVTGKIPELWNPLTGEITKIYTYRQENGYTIIPLHFNPEESKFIVFRKSNEAQPHIIGISKDEVPLFPKNEMPAKSHPFITIAGHNNKLFAQISEPGEYKLQWSNEKETTIKEDKGIDVQSISGQWEISFDTVWGGPEKIATNELKSWTEFEDESIKYYSGTATYKKGFEFSKATLENKKALLNLGNVAEMATVSLNGKTIGNVWISPFTLDVTDYLKDGTNHLVIDVVNLWPNRLILDGKLPENKRLTKTNVIKFDTKGAEKYLRVSGLLGPVKIELISLKEL